MTGDEETKAAVEEAPVEEAPVETNAEIQTEVSAEIQPGERMDPTATTPDNRGDDTDTYSLKVKSGFALKSRPASLPPLPAEPVPEDNYHAGGGSKKTKKKRPRDTRIEAGEKVCMRVMKGEECSYGDTCKFSHDLKAFLATRPADVDLAGGCPNFRLHGYCSFGVMCRFGGTHVNLATGENKRGTLPENPPAAVQNVLSKEVQLQLRKKKFPFQCQRYNEKKGNQEPAATAAPAQDQEETTHVTDMSPLPSKRKLIDFSKKVYVAPLTTCGNLPFRRIMKRFGADITCGEMALSTNLLMGQPSEWALLKRHPDEDIFGVQIAGGYPDQFTRIAEVIETTMEVDFVDLNLGCPLEMLCNKGSGAALMRKESQLKGSLTGMTKVLSCPITIKMRAGWDIAKPFAHVLVPKIQSWGFGDAIGAVMVHGRSRLQRYSKSANWDYIRQVAENQSSEYTSIPIIGNGDIFSYTDYEEKVAREGVSSCAMLARGALIKPWLPTEIKERRHWDISASERLDLLKDFVKFGLEHWGTDQQGVNNCRRFLLEWLSFLHRYVPVGLLEVIPQQMNHRPPLYMCGRNDIETLFLSPHPSDWIKISEMLLGPVPDGFRFEPKHKAKGYATNG
jgi:tRNA-dihydrouridine synthase 3